MDPIEELCAESRAYIKHLQKFQNGFLAKALHDAPLGQTSSLELIRKLHFEQKPPSEVTITNTTHAGIPCVEYTPPAPNATLIWLHGGGWVLGSAREAGFFMAPLAKLASIKVIAIDYPLAPEHPYPAALDASLAAIDAIGTITRGSLFIGGDSAGGNLLTALLTHSYGNLQTRFNGVLMVYPALDLTCKPTPSIERYAKVGGITGVELSDFINCYLRHNEDPSIPSISPISADLSDFPSTLIISAQCDLVLDNAISIASRIPVVRHLIYPGTVHNFVSAPGQPSALNRALKDATTFLTSFKE